MQPCTTPKAPPIDRPPVTRFYVADHREAWPCILPGLEEMLAMYSDNDWSIERVRELLDDDRAFLLVDADDPHAFIVARIDEYPYARDEKELFVLLAWDKGSDAIERGHPIVEAVAREAGAQHLRFYSRRPGFLRAAMRAGFSMRGIEYVKELSHVIR